MTFRVESHPVAQRWVHALKRHIENAEGSREVHFFAFPGEATLARAHYKIRHAVKTINRWRPQTILGFESTPLSQESLNELHHYFESMIGATDSHNAFYLEAPDSVRRAIGVLNDTIHEIEMIKYKSPRVSARFPGCERSDMNKTEMKLFSFDRQFGDIVLGYCQLGKQIMDVWIENDSEVSQDNIRPLQKISPEFELYLRKGLSESEQRERYQLMRPWLIERGYDPENPELCLGWIVVARWQKLNDDVVSSPKDVVQAISDRQESLEIRFENKHSRFILAPPIISY